MKMIKKLFKNEEGATAIEYGLIAALIAVAAIAALSSLGNNLANTFNDVNNELDGYRRGRWVRQPPGQRLKK